MHFARWTFRVAGIYGLILLTPFYFLEHAIAVATVPISHPEYFYGFVGAALAAQLLLLLISIDPRHYRPAMPVAIVSKLSFGIPAWILWLQGRVTGSVTFLATVDLLWAVLFTIAFVVTKERASEEHRKQPS